MIGFINAYRPDGGLVAYQERYLPMFVDYLEKTFPVDEIRVYEPALGDMPGKPEDCSLWVISGSPKNADDTDPWIQALAEFIRACDAVKAKVVGVCFGHQIMAQALGGKVATSDKGWGVGARKFDILKQKSWMDPAIETATLLYSHHDQVMELPEGAEHLGRSDFCEYEAFSVGDHFLCVQAHPEFDTDYARGSLASKRKTLGEAHYDRAIESLKMPLSADVLMRWIRNLR